MKEIKVRALATVAVIAAIFVLVLSLPADAQNGPDALYKSKCAACHGPDGSGSAMGQKLGVHNFHSAEVQKQSDADLTGIIANGKGKMPSYGKTLKADEITGLVAYIRGMAPAK
jgi:cytochrome c6